VEVSSNERRVIAHLYFRYCGPGEDNLAWSITSRLKGVGYLSDYDPLCDPYVVRELKKLPAIVR
jgi:hypothetical protein